MQFLNFYGASNDGYSQPRHCWHPGDLYLYATSQVSSHAHRYSYHRRRRHHHHYYYDCSCYCSWR